MYYVKWMENLGRRCAPYMSSDNWDPWGPLTKAMPFHTSDDALLYIKQPGRSHWIHHIQIIFIHPLNFEERCKRDI